MLRNSTKCHKIPNKKQKRTTQKKIKKITKKKQNPIHLTTISEFSASSLQHNTKRTITSQPPPTVKSTTTPTVKHQEQQRKGQEQIKRIALFAPHSNTTHFYPPHWSQEDISRILQNAEKPLRTFSPAELTKLHPSLSNAYISASFLRQELQVRYAQRILLLRDLPFDICRHPLIQQIQDHYFQSWKMLIESTAPDITQIDELHQFNKNLIQLLKSSTRYPSSVISHAIAVSFCDLLLSQLGTQADLESKYYTTDENQQQQQQNRFANINHHENNSNNNANQLLIATLLDDDVTLSTLFSSVLQEATERFNVSRFDTRLIMSQHISFMAQLFDHLDIDYDYKLTINTQDPIMNDEFGHIIVQKPPTTDNNNNNNNHDENNNNNNNSSIDLYDSKLSLLVDDNDTQRIRPDGSVNYDISNNHNNTPQQTKEKKTFNTKIGFNGFIGIIELQCRPAHVITQVLPHAMLQGVIRTLDDLLDGNDNSIINHHNFNLNEHKLLKKALQEQEQEQNITTTATRDILTTDPRDVTNIIHRNQWISQQQQELKQQLESQIDQPHPNIPNFCTARLTLPDVIYRGQRVPLPYVRLNGDLNAGYLAPRPLLNTVFHELVSNSAEATLHHIIAPQYRSLEDNPDDPINRHKHGETLEQRLSILNAYKNFIGQQDQQDNNNNNNNTSNNNNTNNTTNDKSKIKLPDQNLIPPEDYKPIDGNSILLPPISTWLVLNNDPSLAMKSTPHQHHPQHRVISNNNTEAGTSTTTTTSGVLKSTTTPKQRNPPNLLTLKITDLGNGLSKKRQDRVLTYASTLVDRTLQIIKKYRHLSQQHKNLVETLYASHYQKYANDPNPPPFEAPAYPPELAELVAQLPAIDQYGPTSLDEMCRDHTPRKYGLPLAKCLANYLQYDLSISSVHGLSTDVVLKLKM